MKSHSTAEKRPFGMHSFKFKKVCLFPETLYKEVVIEFFIHLSEKYGSELFLMVQNKEQARYYRQKYGDKITEYVNNRGFLDELLEDEKVLADDLLAKGREIEARFGTKFMRYVISSRHLGRGFSIGAPFFPRSVFSEKTTYWKMVKVIADQYDFFSKVFLDRGIDLVIGGDKIVADVCRALGICQRYLAPYKYKTYAYWGVDEFWGSRILEKEYRSQDGHEAKAPETLPSTYAQVIEKSLALASFKTMVNTVIYLLVRKIYRMARRFDKAKGYMVLDQVRGSVRTWWRMRKLKRDYDVDARGVEKLDYLFFPLHLEPERALATFSPEFFDQMHAIMALSKELPVGTFLVVKEHLYSVSVRPRHYYTLMKEMRNVLLANPFERSLDYIKHSKGVVTISGTAGFEAVLMGKPVVSFGRHNLYNIVPHVHVVKSWDDVGAAIAKVLEEAGEDQDKKRIIEGGRFISAFKKVSANIEEREGHTRAQVFDELESTLLMTLGEA